MVNRFLLECILHSKDPAHIHEGMVIIKTIFENATNYLYNCTSYYNYWKIAQNNKPVTTENLFSVTYELYDQSSHNMNALIHRQDQSLVFVDDDLHSIDILIFAISSSK